MLFSDEFFHYIWMYENNNDVAEYLILDGDYLCLKVKRIFGFRSLIFVDTYIWYSSKTYMIRHRSYGIKEIIKHGLIRMWLLIQILVYPNVVCKIGSQW